MTPTLVANLAAALPFVLLAGPVIGLFYGDRFDAAVAPAQLLVVGMLLGGAAGVASGYLYGRGRPGLNSLGARAGPGADRGARPPPHPPVRRDGRRRRVDGHLPARATPP